MSFKKTGTPTESTVFCKCGTKLESSVCPKCGKQQLPANLEKPEEDAEKKSKV